MATKTFQQGTDSYTGCEDSTIRQLNADNNLGGAVRVEMTNYGTSNDYMNTVIKFDLSGEFTGTETVTSATISLKYAGNRNGKSTKSVDIAALRRDWGEGTVTSYPGGATASTGDVTWDDAEYNTTAWTTSGALDTTDDRYLKESTTELSSSLTVGDWVELDVTDMVQDWIDGAKDNYGAVIYVSDGDASGGTWEFESSEATTTANRPELEINYTAGEVSTFISRVSII